MKPETTLRTVDSIDSNYLAACELADCSHSLAEHVATLSAPSLLDTAPPDAEAGTAGTAEGAVVGGSLIAFAEGVSRQNKEDIMDSFLFATLVANKAFNPESQSDLWYGKFNDVLSKLGWLSTHWSYARYRAAQQRFSMDEVGLEILGSAIAAASLPGPASVAMLKVAKDAVTALSAKKEPLRLFERQTKTHRGGNFRIAACSESADGGVSLAMAAVAFSANTNVTNVLFWEWQHSDVETYRGENNLVFNTRVYAGVRAVVQEKLGKSAESAIEAFEI
ncbi:MULTISPECIES: hypothetical protein [Pseudomonas]|uniref:Uncharacterized protein n=2 Tax=Pseudomonas TaxID=286 RepID=A0ABX6H805_9PSED|nr:MULTISPECIES: hypothetical protein [Pseudomonas]MBC3956946.1 hypothetical protein [Pseudomonas triticifolii]QHF01588.1 hypothetical protein N015_03810 [Pseudomonas asturiensis]